VRTGFYTKRDYPLIKKKQPVSNAWPDIPLRPYSAFKLVFSAFCLFLLIWTLVFYIHFALVSPPSFDGALNLNVAKSLAEGKGYGSYYNEFRLFPKETQTNLPFILPAAIAYAMGGICIFTSQVVNLIYLIFFSWGLYGVIRKMEAAPIAILAVFLALQVPGFKEFGMSGYGEIPALSFLMLGLLLLNLALKKNHLLYSFLGGGALGFSYLTKTVALLWAAPTMALFALLMAARKRSRISLISLGAGFIVPVIGWELYRFFCLGGVEAYIFWWFDQMREILSQSGVHGHLQDTPGFLSKGFTHLRILSEGTGTPLISLLAMWIAPLPLVIKDMLVSWRKGNDSRFFLLGALALIAILYATWWMFITPTEQAWLRRILNGLVLQEVIAILIMSSAARLAWKTFAPRAESVKQAIYSKWHAVMHVAIIFMLGTSTFFLFMRGQVLFLRPPSAAAYAAELEMFEVVHDLPAQARIFGFGWWQAPVIALFSGRNIDDLEQWRIDDVVALPDKYIVMDQYALAIAPKTIAQLQKVYELNPLHISVSGKVFSIVRERTLKSQVNDSNSDIKSFIELDGEDYPHVRGVYEREGNMRWASPEVRILLWRTDENLVSAEVTVPEGLMGFNDDFEKNDPVVLGLFSKGCAEASMDIPKPGRYRIEAQLTCAPEEGGAPIEVLLTLNSHLDPLAIVPDTRSLAFRVHTMELLCRHK
jgi:hypothetical protein